MFYNDIYEKLKKLQKTAGSVYGTQTERALLNAVGSPDDGLKIIHVAASNGKGSICAFITSVLTANGNAVGTFTSPAVFSYAEQFAVNGGEADEVKLKTALTDVYNAAQNIYPSPTAFEIETAAALLLFYRENCEYAVLECGLGGLNDATNAVNDKLIAVIGSVSLEHTAVLGDTVSEICAQKAGIIKNCPAVISALQSGEGLEYFSRYTAAFSGEGLTRLSQSEEGQTFAYNGCKYFIRLHGEAQCYNAALAADCCRMLGVQPYVVCEGLERVSPRGRVEIIKKSGKTYILDGSHNPAAFSPLRELLTGLYADKSKTIIYGCLSDKDVCGCARALSGCAQKYVAVRPDSYRAMDIDKIYDALRQNCGGETEQAESVTRALAESCGEVVAVCGSFTLLAEVKRWIEKEQ